MDQRLTCSLLGPDMISNVNVVDNLPSTNHDAMLNVTVPSQSPCRQILYNYKKADMSVFLATLSGSYSLAYH